MAELQDIVGEQPEEAAPKVEPVETPAEPVAEETPPEGETTTPDETPKEPEETPEVQTVPKAALLDERGKRQALEAQLREIQTKPEEKADPVLEPEKAFQQMEQGFEKKLLSNRADTSELIHRNLHDDFDEMKNRFFDEIAPNNPVLAQQALQELDPYGFIYKTATEHSKMEKYGDLTKMEDTIRAEERAKVLAEIKAEADQKAATAANIPGTLSTARAAGNNAKPAFVKPSLKNIVG